MLITLLMPLIARPTADLGWKGDFTMIIRGEGSLKTKTSSARWKIDRVAKGVIVLDRPIRGAIIAGSPDRNNEKRYESWIGSRAEPFMMTIRDEVVQRGPLFSPKEIRRDTLRVTTPPEGTTGKLGWPSLQIDLENGQYLWEAPRLEAPAQSYFQREFIEGPKSWTDQAPLVQDRLELGYQIIHNLNQPKEWFRFAGPIKPGQVELVLTRKFPFTVALMAGITPPKVEAELTLVLRRIMPGGEPEITAGILNP